MLWNCETLDLRGSSSGASFFWICCSWCLVCISSALLYAEQARIIFTRFLGIEFDDFHLIFHSFNFSCLFFSQVVVALSAHWCIEFSTSNQFRALSKLLIAERKWCLSMTTLTDCMELLDFLSLWNQVANITEAFSICFTDTTWEDDYFAKLSCILYKFYHLNGV